MDLSSRSQKVHYIGTRAYSPEQHLPVKSGKKFLLHDVHAASFLALVERQRLQRLRIVVKLRHDAFVSSRHQGAGRVTIVLKTTPTYIGTAI